MSMMTQSDTHPRPEYDWLTIANRLDRFRDCHKGEEIILICNGPSLNKTDFSKLRGRTIMGLNKIYLGFSKYKFYPNYYLAVNKEIISQSASAISRLRCVNFIASGNHEGKIQSGPLTHWVKADLSPMGFSKDICFGIHQGWTVTHAGLQVAYFMGFSRVIIVGMDHRYQYDGHPNELKEMTGPDVNHFCPDYFRGCLWNNPDLSQAEDAYRIARHTYEEAGRAIIDCTVDGACKVFDKCSLEEVL
jgi:hypothetical protein